MIPFVEVQASAKRAVSAEAGLARNMGTPPFPIERLAAETPVARWALSQKAERIGFMFDSQFWYPAELWRDWIAAVEAEPASGWSGLDAPLGNQNPEWRSGLAVPLYATLRQVEEAAAFAAQNNPLWIERTVCDPMDVSVVMAPVASLRELPEDVRIGDLPRRWAERRQPVRLFCKGWLHAFAVVAEEGMREDLLAMTDWQGRVLELGCGAGRMAERCRELGHTVWWMGLDMDSVCLSEARERLDAAVCCDLNRGLPLREGQRFDRIVCADVLEHLAYPWRVLVELRRHVTDDGRLVASFPNVGHWSAVADLLAGRWDETPSGLCCVTHLRFGTRKSWERWLLSSGWEPIRWEEERFPMPEIWERMLALSPVSWDKTSLETIRYRVVAVAATMHR